MATIFRDVYGKCALPICRCDTVVLCMTDEWNTRTTNGLGIAFGRVFSISKTAIPTLPYTNQTLCCPSTTVTYNNTCNPCVPTQTCVTTTTTCPNDCPMCVFKVEIDTTQFEIDPETGTNYEPDSSDIVDISPYSCLAQKYITALTPT